jgi:hypothetical protein
MGPSTSLTSQKLSMSLAEWVPTTTKSTSENIVAKLLIFLVAHSSPRGTSFVKRVSGGIRSQANICVLEKPAKTP